MLSIAIQRLQHMNKSCVNHGEKQVLVTESHESGKGTITFLVDAFCICIRLPMKPIKWLREQKCADSTILQFQPEGMTLHLVELKSKLTLSEWFHCKQQFLGAYHNGLAVIGVLGLPAPSSVKLHIAFREDAISFDRTTAPSTLKSGVGEKLEGALDWINKRVELEARSAVPLAVIQRDNDGNANVAL